MSLRYVANAIDRPSGDQDSEPYVSPGPSGAAAMRPPAPSSVGATHISVAAGSVAVGFSQATWEPSGDRSNGTDRWADSTRRRLRGASPPAPATTRKAPASS